MLRDGRIREGEKLPNQHEFARMLGVSRVSLREALRILQDKGILRQGPKTGTVILNGNPDTWGKDSKNIELTENGILQMLLARKCVETTINLEAAKHLTPEQGNALTKISRAMPHVVRTHDTDNFLLADKEFHMVVANACRNMYLRSMYEISLRQEDDLMKRILQDSRPEAFKNLVLSHQATADAIAKGDTSRIIHATNRHSQYLEDIMTAYLLRDQPPIQAN